MTLQPTPPNGDEPTPRGASTVTTGPFEHAPAPAPVDGGPFRADGWTDANGRSLIEHLGRDTIHASKDRNFASAWRRNAAGENKPRLYPVESEALARCQYAVLSHPQRTAVVVIDIDRATGATSGRPDAIHSEPLRRLTAMSEHGHGPAWIGVNPLSGKAQVLWLIDPVFAAPGRSSPGMRLLRTVTRELNASLSGDAAFSHYFSRWPLHRSSDPAAYRWHWQHDRVVRLADLLEEARHMGTASTTDSPDLPAADRSYVSGRERILAARKAAADAKALRELADALPDVAEVAPAAAGVVDGVRVLWTSPGRAARDMTAFQHALTEARSLRAAGKVMRDEKIIAAYERAYAVAQAVGADGREPEMPEIGARLSMARRVRGYAISQTRSARPTGEERDLRSPGRKALATMGAKGGRISAERRTSDRELGAATRERWERANKQRSRKGAATRARIYSLVTQSLEETGARPTRREIAQEVGISIRQVSIHIAALRDAGLIDAD